MNRFLQLTPEEITRIYNRPVGNLTVRARIVEAHNYLVFQAETFDGAPFPLTDEGQIVRAVHEGVCATCGRGTIVEPGDYKNPLEQTSWKTRCAEGHQHHAIPSESGCGDWTGW